MDYLVHFLLEAVGSVIALVAYRSHRCQSITHKVSIWLVLTAVTTVVTIQAVG